MEILLDPRGNASQSLKDIANTFNLGIFPFAQSGRPCGERDADSHQDYSSGALDTGRVPTDDLLIQYAALTGKGVQLVTSSKRPEPPGRS